MGTAGVPDRYPLPPVERIVEGRCLYCRPGPKGNLIQAKYFGKVRDDVAVSDCCVSQLKVKAGDSAPTES
jgi:glutamine synthetase type III